MEQIEAWLGNIHEDWDAKPELEKNIIAVIGVLCAFLGVFQIYIGG